MVTKNKFGFKFNSTFKAVVLLLFALLVVQEGLRSEIVERITMIHLLPPSEARKVDVSEMKVQGHLKDSDRKEIFSLYGRIPGIDHKPLIVDVAWGDIAFACRIKTQREDVVFVQVEGNWVVSAIMPKRP